MTHWWPDIGQPSILAGLAFGLLWALVCTARRRRQFISQAMMPVDQKRWFVIHFIGMGSYLTLVIALGLLAGHGIIPVSLMWFMLGLSGTMFFAAMSIGTVPEPRITASAKIARNPSAEPPIEPFPFRRSA